MSCGAGTTVAEVELALAAHGQRVAIPPGGTVGGALAVGRSSIRRLGDGPVRDAVLQVRYVSAAGEVVKAGGPTVKNVSGFDLCRLLVGSHGTLGFIGDVILRTRPRAPLRRGTAATATRSPCSLRCTGRCQSCGTGRRRGCCSRATSATSPPKRRCSGCRRPTARRSCRPVGGGRSHPTDPRADRHVRRRARRRDRAPRRPGATAARRTRRWSSCTGASRRASTPPAGSTPVSIHSMADARRRRRPARRVWPRRRRGSFRRPSCCGPA